ncbi:hypothetical protein FRB91_007189, partial [Serendipita sp. 411]
GRPPVDYNSSQPGGSSSDQCIASPLVSESGLAEAPHQLVVTNSAGGKLELSGITYTGKGAFGTPEDKPGPSSPSAAVIGGSVGGAIGAIVIGGILFLMYRKRRNGGPNNGANNGGAGAGAGGAGGAAIDNQMMQQANAPPTGSPYAGMGGGFPSPTNSGHQSLPSQDQHQPFGYPQQPQYSYQPGSPNPSYQYGQGGTPNYAPPPAAPLPSWIQRASQPNNPADAASMTSATRSSGMGVPVGASNEAMQQPNSFYGSYYTPNAQVNNPGRY